MTFQELKQWAKAVEAVCQAANLKANPGRRPPMPQVSGIGKKAGRSEAGTAAALAAMDGGANEAADERAKAGAAASGRAGGAATAGRTKAGAVAGGRAGGVAMAKRAEAGAAMDGRSGVATAQRQYGAHSSGARQNVEPQKEAPQDEAPRMENRRADARLAELRRAVAWSEILGEPACKKRKRKRYGC